MSRPAHPRLVAHRREHARQPPRTSPQILGERFDTGFRGEELHQCLLNPAAPELARPDPRPDVTEQLAQSKRVVPPDGAEEELLGSLGGEPPHSRLHGRKEGAHGGLLPKDERTAGAGDGDQLAAKRRRHGPLHRRGPHDNRHGVPGHPLVQVRLTEKARDEGMLARFRGQFDGADGALAAVAARRGDVTRDLAAAVADAADDRHPLRHLPHDIAERGPTPVDGGQLDDLGRESAQPGSRRRSPHELRPATPERLDRDVGIGKQRDVDTPVGKDMQQADSGGRRLLEVVHHDRSRVWRRRLHKGLPVLQDGCGLRDHAGGVVPFAPLGGQVREREDVAVLIQKGRGRHPLGATR